MHDERKYELLEQRLGISRWDFMKFRTGVAATIGLTTSDTMALASPKARPSEIMVTVGIVSAEIMAYLVFVKKLPVLHRAEHA